MIIGHKKILNFLERQIEKEALAQAYIFSGPQFVGKKTVALYWAEKILNRKISETDSAVFILSSDTKEIGIEDVRNMIHQMSLTGNEKKMIFIIDEAEKLGKTSQNALLKSIEEPQENKLLILITHNEKRLLPTILSRCQKINFNLVKEKEIEDFFSENKEEDKQLIKFWSLGRPGLVFKFLDNPQEREDLKKIFSNFKTLFQGKAKDKIDLAQELAKNKKKLILEMELWLFFLRKALLKLDDKIKISSKKSFFLVEEIVRALEKIKNTQSNSRIILEDLFFKF